jgi:hypothetical protein
VLCALAPAGARAEISEKLAQQIYAESGAERQLADSAADFPKAISDAMQGSEKPLPFAPEQIEAAARRAYDVSITARVVIDKLRTTLTGQDAKNVRAWLGSPLGRRITALEVAMGSPDADAAMQAYAESLHEHPPAEERMTLVHRLDEALRVTEGAVKVYTNMSVAIAVGVLDASPYTDEDAVRKLKESIEEKNPEIAESVRQQVLLTLLYSYREVSDADLQRYIAFGQSPSGKRYQDAMIEGIDRALTVAGVRFGRELSNLTPLEKSEASTWNPRLGSASP